MNRVESTYRAWRMAAESGYGTRHNSPAAMARVDARIRRLKAKYESALEQSKRNPPCVP